MSRFARRVLTAAAVGALALTTMGSAGDAAGAAAGAPQSLGPPEYSSAWVGYGTSGRWFRYVSTTVTVPPRVVPPSPGAPSQRGDATIFLYGIGSVVPTQITVAPAGGPVSWGDPGGSGTFRISPRTGDRLTLSIYYDQHGHVYLTATDITRHTTQTVRTHVPKMTYLHARLFAWVYNDVTPPLADTPLWQFTNSRVTTYSGDHGTLVGPWTTSKTIVSTASTASGTVIASPSGLSNGGQDFTAWFRALPLGYTDGLAGYEASDLTQAVARTARVNADLAGTAYTTAVIGGEISNSAVTPPPADTRLWDFSSSHVTTYSGDKGTILGPWATSEIVDTINASTSGTVVMSPSALSNGSHNFGIWLRHQ